MEGTDYKAICFSLSFYSTVLGTKSVLYSGAHGRALKEAECLSGLAKYLGLSQENNMFVKGDRIRKKHVSGLKIYSTGIWFIIHGIKNLVVGLRKFGNCVR